MRLHHLQHSAAALALLITCLWPFTYGPSVGALGIAVAGLGILVWLGFADLRHEASGRLLAWAVLGAALCNAAIGVVPLAGQAADFSPWMSVPSGEEIYGNVRQRNQFATLCNAGFLALLALLGARRTGPAPAVRGAQVVFAMAAAALLAVGVAASASRTGFVQLVVILALAAIWAWGDARAARVQSARVQPASSWALGAVLGVATLVYACSSWLLATAEVPRASILLRDAAGGEGCSSRLVLWQNVGQLIAERPRAGWGWGALDEAHFMAVFPQRFCSLLDNAHNLPLHLAVEWGVPAAFLVCAGMAWFMRVQARGLLGTPAGALADEDSTDHLRAVLAVRRMAWGVLLLIGLHSLLEYPLWYGPFQLLAVLAVLALVQLGLPQEAVPGALKAQNGLARSVRGAVKKVAVAIAWPLVGAAVVLGVWLAWQYVRLSQIYIAPDQRLSWIQGPALPPAYEVPFLRGLRDFAQLTTTKLNPAPPAQGGNATEQLELAERALRHSPEARVVERLIESLVALGRASEAVVYAQRYRAAYPEEFEVWRGASSAATEVLAAGAAGRPN